MARRTIKQRKKEKRIIQALAGVLAVAVLGTLMIVVPGFENTLFDWLGINKKVAVQRAVEGPTAVHFIDVGQGDAVLLEQDGEFALIDAGPPEGTEELIAYLKGAGVESLRYIFMTHPHLDHYAGMQQVIESFPVQQMVLPVLDKAPYPTAATFLSLLDCLTYYNVPTSMAAAGEVYPLGSASVTVLQDGLESSDYNLLSLVLFFEAEGFRFIATGDAEKQNEQALLESYFSLRADVLHAGHHGSSTSNTAAFVQAVNPSIVVVGCAAGNSYGHPHAEVLENFAAVNALVLRNDLHSHIVVQPDGEGGLAYTVMKGEV